MLGSRAHWDIKKGVKEVGCVCPDLLCDHFERMMGGVSLEVGGVLGHCLPHSQWDAMEAWYKQV